MRIFLALLVFPLIIHAEEAKWPDLKSFKYVSGRVATEADIKNKSAIFVLKVNGKYIGTPLKIELPQYAMYTDGKMHRNIKVVVIQAESAQGMSMYGAIDIRNGKGIVSVSKTFKLLGKKIRK